MQRSWVELSSSSLISNFTTFKRIVGADKAVCCVVKADAFGHGLQEVVQILQKHADWFAVDNIKEALAIRGMGVKSPILVLGYILLTDLHKAIDNDISFVVYNKVTLQKIVALGSTNKARVHLKIETGLNRQGILLQDLDWSIQYSKKHRKYIDVEGVSTHFANIEDTVDPSFANTQFNRFSQAIEFLKREGISPPYVHCAATAGILLYDQFHCTMVRLGLGLYGLWPSEKTEKVYKKMKSPRVKLEPVLSWKSRIAQIKRIEKGESVGYGRTWIANKKSTIAIVPVGYSDGYDRNLSNSSWVIIKGKRVPVVGRIAMNMFMVDVSDISGVKLEDEVVLIGKQGDEEIQADEISERINYEIVARINPLLPRIISK